jgi:head-tail adaptor
MKYLAPKLKQRIQVQKTVQALGRARYDRDYETIGTLWAFIEVLNPSGVNFGTEQVRYQNTGTEDTHRVTVRTAGLLAIGKAFTSAFNNNYDIIASINPLKADYFIFHEGATENQGRLFKVNRIMRDEHFREFYVLRCREVEEKGTGAYSS